MLQGEVHDVIILKTNKHVLGLYWLRGICPKTCLKVGHFARLSVRLLRKFLLQKRIQTWKSRLPAGVEKYPKVLNQREGLKLLMRLSGYPIGVKRGAAEQTPAREAICDEEELHRIQGEKSQGDYF